MPSIYISIPSVLDTELEETVNRCINMASPESDIRIGVGYLLHDDEKGYAKNLDGANVSILNREYSMGIGIARIESMRFYDKQDYFLQIDGHTLFKKNWDSILIELLSNCPSESSVLSCYPPEYSYTNYQHPECKNWSNKYISTFNAQPIIDRTPHGYGCDACEEFSALPGWGEEKIANDSYRYIENPKLSGGFIFASGKFANEYQKLVPYHFSFFDDELVMSIEAHSLGWKFYAPPGELPIAHLYAEDINSYGGDRSSLVESEVLKLNVKSNYLNYILDPKNKDKIERFEKHANVDIIHRAEVEKRKVEK